MFQATCYVCFYPHQIWMATSNPPTFQDDGIWRRSLWDVSRPEAMMLVNGICLAKRGLLIKTHLLFLPGEVQWKEGENSGLALDLQKLALDLLEDSASRAPKLWRRNSWYQLPTSCCFVILAIILRYHILQDPVYTTVPPIVVWVRITSVNRPHRHAHRPTQSRKLLALFKLSSQVTLGWASLTPWQVIYHTSPFS